VIAVQLPAADRRLIDYEWHRPGYDPGFWHTVNLFCGDCAEFTCPVPAAIQRADPGRRPLLLNAETAAIQNACPYVAEFQEAAAGQVPVRRAS
jgi:hypothetical protein